MNFDQTDCCFSKKVKIYAIYSLLLFFSFIFSHSSFSQIKIDSTSAYSVKADSTLKTTTDTLARKKSKHSPALATILSTVVPGAGQIYNRKYWKLPIVWGGIGAFTYLFAQQNIKYKQYKQDYASRLNDTSNSYISPFPNYDNAQILQLKENTQFNRDLFIIISSVFYVLNIVDANVDGHLFNFDVSEKLTINLKPTATPASAITMPNTGLSLSLKLR